MHTGDHDVANVGVLQFMYDRRRLRFEFVLKHNQTDKLQLTFHRITAQ